MDRTKSSTRIVILKQYVSQVGATRLTIEQSVRLMNLFAINNPATLAKTLSELRLKYEDCPNVRVSIVKMRRHLGHLPPKPNAELDDEKEGSCRPTLRNQRVIIRLEEQGGLSEYCPECLKRGLEVSLTQGVPDDIEDMFDTDSVLDPWEKLEDGPPDADFSQMIWCQACAWCKEDAAAYV